MQAGKGLATHPFPLNMQVLDDKNDVQLVAEAEVASVHTYALQFADAGVVSMHLPSNPILVEHPSVVKYVVHEASVATQPLPVEEQVEIYA